MAKDDCKEDSKLIFAESGDGKEMNFKLFADPLSNRVIDCELGNYFVEKFGKTDSVLLKDLIISSTNRLIVKLLDNTNKNDKKDFSGEAYSEALKKFTSFGGDNFDKVLKSYKNTGLDLDKMLKNMGFDSMNEAVDSIKDAVLNFKDNDKKDNTDEE